MITIHDFCLLQMVYCLQLKHFWLLITSKQIILAAEIVNPESEYLHYEYFIYIRIVANAAVDQHTANHCVGLTITFSQL